MLSNKTIIYLIVFLLIIMVIIGFSFSKYREKFEDSSDSYQSRLTVIDVFDSYLKRNPTPKEINKYSALKNEQDILSAVMNDFPHKEMFGNNITTSEETSVQDENHNLNVNLNEPTNLKKTGIKNPNDYVKQKSVNTMDEYYNTTSEDVTLNVSVVELQNMKNNLQSTIKSCSDTISNITDLMNKVNL